MTIAVDKPVARTFVTAEAFLELSDHGPSELVRGEIIEMPTPGARHGEVALAIGATLRQHVRERDLGKVVGNDAGFLLRRNPDTVRGPDVSFIRRARVPAQGLPPGYIEGPPDLAIEVVSPHDKITEVHDKVDQLLDAGCPLVVLLDPQRRTATLHRPGLDPHVVRAPEPLDLSSVVDGFTCPLADLFG